MIAQAVPHGRSVEGDPGPADDVVEVLLGGTDAAQSPLGRTAGRSPLAPAHDRLAEQPEHRPPQPAVERPAHLLDLVPDVSGQRLVGALAREHDLVSLHMDLGGQAEHARAGRVEHRALGRHDQLGEGVGDGTSVHPERRQAGPQHAGRLDRLRPLVMPGAVEADREGRDRLTLHPARQAEDRRRIQAPADVAHHRHVAMQSPLDCRGEPRLQFIDQRFRVGHPTLLSRVGEVEVPVLAELDPAPLDPQVVPRRDRPDPLEESPRHPGRRTRRNDRYPSCQAATGRGPRRAVP